jgi:hypothetical protein
MSRSKPQKSPECLRFVECGFSDRTAAALVKAGISAPEQLLPMASDRILLIPGIGATLMKEIAQYRERAIGTT